MTNRTMGRAAALALAVLCCMVIWNRPLWGDEPSRLGRLFRFGGSSTPSVPSPTPIQAVPVGPAEVAAPTLEPNATASESIPTAPSGITPRIIPQPRNYRGITDSDPIVTRITLARTSEGASFGMFLQVFADGTVIDSEGVHQTGREGVKPLLGVLNSDELYRLKGHCGGPPTDFVEDVHVVVYDRSLGRLRANAFSFSGNPQGCDPSVRRLQTVLDALQASYSRPATPAAPASSPPPREIRLNAGLERP
jgi:hypothetical protein